MLTRGAASPSAPVSTSTRARSAFRCFSKDCHLTWIRPTAASSWRPTARRPSCATNQSAYRSPFRTARPRLRAGRLSSTATAPAAPTVPRSSWALPITTPRVLDPGGLAVPTATLGYDGILHGTRNGALPGTSGSWSTTSSIRARHATMPCRPRLICWPSRARLAPSPPSPSRSIPRMWRCTGIRRVEMPLP